MSTKLAMKAITAVGSSKINEVKKSAEKKLKGGDNSRFQSFRDDEDDDPEAAHAGSFCSCCPFFARGQVSNVSS